MSSRKTRERLTRAVRRFARIVKSSAAPRSGMPVCYLADGDPEIDAMMEAVGRIAGGARRLELAGVAWQDFPETAARSELAYATAKKPASNPVLAALKQRLYRGQYNWARTRFEANPGIIALAWNGRTSTRLAYMEAARDAGAGRLYMERAPLPGRVTLDPEGINQLASVPRDRAFYDIWAGDDPRRSGEEWREIGTRLVARASSRADVGQGAGAALPDAPFLFCPLQVPNDTQIRQFAGWVGTIEGQIRAMGRATELLPAGWHIRVKEHPSSRIALGPLLAEVAAGTGGRLVVDNTTDTFAQVAASRGVITVNSSVGLQAFFHDRPVMVLGQAFYAQPGLVDVADDEVKMRALFADPDRMGYDAGFRARFMNWLDKVYYPKVELRKDGTAWIDPEVTAAKIASARSMARLGSYPA